MPAHCRLAVLPLLLLMALAPASLTRAQQKRGARPPWKSSRIKGSPTAPEPYQIHSSFPAVKFTKPTSLAEMPDGRRILVTEMAGKVLTIRKSKDVAKADLALDLAELLPDDLAGQELSLFSAALHPKFQDNRTLFVCYVHPGDGKHTRVSRFTVPNSEPPTIDGDSEQVVIAWPAGGHNAGCLRFGKDGYLYISTGDGFGPNPPDKLNTAQDVSDLRGALLRIDVDQRAGATAYAIPQDNPFVDRAGARGEIWAYGLRNPWKFGVDRVNGEIFAADNGWESWEMIHRIERGGNCGWPIMEGRALLRTEVVRGPTPIIAPVKDHPHTEANSVIGGPIYRGDRLEDLAGSFVYGDYITGTIWALKTDGSDDYSHRTLLDTDLRIVDFAEGSDGELYVLDYDLTGQIYELSPSREEDTSADFPRLLSDTGLFKSLKDLQPEDGVVPYRVKASRWDDGARARRWVALPGDSQITLARDKQRGDYPEGAVLVKHLEFGKRGQQPKPVETQILHHERGQWRPYSYLWDDAGADARLVPGNGANQPLRIPNAAAPKGFTERTWRVGAQNECKLCHNAGSNYVLGFMPHQLDLPGQPLGQLERLARRRVLAKTPEIPPGDSGRLVNPHDSSQSLEDRARSYLHVNCSSCHHPGGNAIVSFYLRRDMPLEKLNTNKGTGIGAFGIDHAKLLTPGDPYRSVITYRMSKLGYARMPYIGSQVVDSRGVALVNGWIRSLASDAKNPLSAPAKDGTADATALDALSRDGATKEERQRAIELLLKTTEGSLALVDRMHRRSLDRETMRTAVKLGSKARGNVSGLFDHFLPESRRRVRLGPAPAPETILQRKGSEQRGRLIFFSDAARCRNCHQINDANLSVGPTLEAIAKQYPRRSELLQHVLQPSLKIEDKFATHMVLKNDGRLFTGLLQQKTDKHVVLRTAEGKTVAIANEDIDEMRKSTKSLMPDNIVSDLTPQEASDLVAFIQSLQKPAGSQ